VRRGIATISKTNTATKRHENIDQRDIAMPFHCPSLSSQYHRPHHRYVLPSQEEEELMLRGKHENEEKSKHRASAATSDSRTTDDANGKFDLGGSAPASFRLHLRMSFLPIVSSRMPRRCLTCFIESSDRTHQPAPASRDAVSRPRWRKEDFRKRGTLFWWNRIETIA
jgi:hypothetical protein